MGLEWEEPHEALKQSIRDQVGTLMLNLKRDMTKNEDINELVKKVVHLCAMIDPTFSTFKELPVWPITAHILSSI
jgi:hypothetical protein